MYVDAERTQRPQDQDTETDLTVSPKGREKAGGGSQLTNEPQALCVHPQNSDALDTLALSRLTCLSDIHTGIVSTLGEK